MILKLLSYNIWFGGRKRQSAIAEVIKQIAPDVVVFQEAIDPSVIEYLSDECEMPHWGARKKHSIGFVSRLEIAHYEWHHPARAKHAFLEIQLARSETRIVGLHLSARFSKWSERQRHREIQALLKSIERHQHGFHVIVGDFNTLAPGEVFNFGMMPLWIRAMIFLSGRDIQRDTIQTISARDTRTAFGGFTRTKKVILFLSGDHTCALIIFFCRPEILMI